MCTVKLTYNNNNKLQVTPKYFFEKLFLQRMRKVIPSHLRRYISVSENPFVQKDLEINKKCEEALLELLKTHYGYNPNGRNLTIKIKAKKNLSENFRTKDGAYHLVGDRPICQETRESEYSITPEDVEFIDGTIKSTERSTEIPYGLMISQGSIFELTVPEEFLAEINENEWEIIS